MEPPQGLAALLEESLVVYKGTTDADGNVGGTTLKCSAIGSASTYPDFDGNQIILTSGSYKGQARDINGATNGDAAGTITVANAFDGMIVSGTSFIITGIRSTAAEVQVLGLTSFKQESVAATDVNGTTWKDLLDKSTLTKPTKICGFTVTVAGTWAGNAKIRIVDGAGNKIFPFKDEYVQGTDFFSATQVDFTFAVVVPITDGYKVQFRSSNAADGAGDTLQLNNLDVIETG